ncbi:MAG: hypothetical protein Tsb0010_08490 [Parvularculaceae bacterium]
MVVSAALATAAAGSAQAQDLLALPGSPTAFGLNTLADMAVFAGVLFAASGLYLRDVGFAGAGAPGVAERYIAVIAVAVILHWGVGYHLAHTDVSRFLGTPSPWLGADQSAIEGTRAEGGVFLRSAAFTLLALLIATGGFGARMRGAPVVIFAVIFATAVAPPVMAWIWGGGWLADLGARDAGGGAFHVAGGAAALAGMLVLRGAAVAPGEVEPSAGALGALIAWAGLGAMAAFAGASFGDVDSADRFADAVVYTNLSAVGGAAGGAFFARATQLVRVDFGAVYGLIAGLAAIAWAPDSYTAQSAVIAGAIAGALATLAPALLGWLRNIDPCGVVSAHLVGGAWGALAAGALSQDFNLASQAIAAGAIAAYAFAASLLVFLMLLFTIGLASEQSNLEPDDDVDGETE